MDSRAYACLLIEPTCAYVSLSPTITYSTPAADLVFYGRRRVRSLLLSVPLVGRVVSAAAPARVGHRVAGRVIDVDDGAHGRVRARAPLHGVRDAVVLAVEGVGLATVPRAADPVVCSSRFHRCSPVSLAPSRFDSPVVVFQKLSC